MIQRISVLLLLGIWSLYSQDVMTAEDAIRIGLKNNFDIQIARNNLEVVRNNTGLGTAGFLPLLDASGNAQYSVTDQETNSPFSFGNSSTESYGAAINLNWTLFDGMRMFVSKSRFNELVKQGEAQTRNIIEKTIVEILRAYFNLVQQEQLLEVSQNTMEISETRLNKERVRRDVGGASSTDLLNAQVSYNNDRALFLNQQLQVSIALKELNILLARDPNTAVKVDRQIRIPPLPYSYQEMLEMVFERNSTLVAARHGLEVAQKNINIARSSYSPRLSLNGSYGYLERTVSSDNPNFPDDIQTNSTDGLIGLALNWNLFNGFRDRINIQNARIETRNQELALENIRNQMQGILLELYETYQKRLELVELEEENVVAARQNLQLQQDRYQIGTSSSLEFRDAQINFDSAQNTLIVARFQARITRLEIE
ncbi:MAG: TolC family protein, partial [Calditrichaeota bacterium]